MKPQTTFRISLAATIFSAFLLSPINSHETAASNSKQTFSVQVQADHGATPDQGIKLDLTLPVNNKKEKGKDTDHGHEFLRNKRHADEDRHDNHHHNFDKGRSRRRIINVLTGYFLKIIIAVSYFSILLCSYMSITH